MEAIDLAESELQLIEEKLRSADEVCCLVSLISYSSSVKY